MKFGHTLPFGGEDTLLAQSTDNLGVVQPADAFPGTGGDDNLTGTSGDDTFDLTAGGDDTVHALGGNDIITMGATLTAADSIDGGDGNDTVSLSGDYFTSPLVLGANTLTNVEDVFLATGHSYNITTNDGTVADGATLTIDGSQLGVHDFLIFDGSAEQTGAFNVFVGGGGAAEITTGQGSDYVDASGGGNDTIDLGGDQGDPDQNGDFVFFGAQFTINDSVDGGDPETLNNEVELQGNYRIGLKAQSLVNVGNLYLASGANLGGQSFSYYLVENDANVSSGQAMQVIGSSLHAGESLHFDGSAETDGSFLMFGGAGNDTLIGGAGDDYFRGGAGDDFMDGGAGKNRATFSDSHTGVTVNLATHVAQNTGDGMDTIRNMADVSGGSGNDTLTGDVNNNWLWGEGGNDTIVGNGGDDIIQVGTLTGTLGTDTVDGGAGHDTIDFDENGGSYGGVTFSLASQGTAQVTGVDTVNAVNFENVNGSDFNDMLTGNTTGNVLYGGAGTDILSGGDGNDTLYGDKVLVPAESNGPGGDGPTGVLDSDPGTGGDDALTGGAGNDILDGGEGDDTAIYSDATGSVTVNLTLTGAQNIGGGDGKDTLTSIENIIGSTFADKLTGDDHANIFTGNGGGDTISGGGGDDTINLTGSGNVTITGGAGDDYIDMTGPGYLTTLSRVDGGADSDTLALSGDYSAGVIFSTSTVANVETMTFAVGNDYKIKTADGTVAAGQDMTIDASQLGSSDTLNFNGSRETDGSFRITGGAGNDLIVGSLTGDTIRGALGADHIIESGGDNTLVYFGVGESTGLAHDLVSGFNAVNDQFLMSVTVNAVDAAVNAGQLRTAHFDTDLASAVGSGQLAAHDAVVFTANSGTLSGHTYLIVDANGVAGYQAGADYVIELSGASNLGSLNADNFSHLVT